MNREADWGPPRPASGQGSKLIRDFRFLAAIIGRNEHKQLERWEEIREDGPKYFVLIGAALGSYLSLCFVVPELLVDLLSPPVRPPLYYLWPVLAFGVIGGLAALALYVNRAYWYRWVITGDKPDWLIDYEEQQIKREKRILRQGPIKYMVLNGLVGGALFVFAEYFFGFFGSQLRRSYESPEYLLAFLFGFVFACICTIPSLIKATKRQQQEEEGVQIGSRRILE